MRISTIIATYNHERYITQALESVLAQSLPSDEIIVVDDGSTDGTPKILRSFAARIRIIHQENCGPSRALNVAIAASTADTLAFLDSDDLWRPEKLQIQTAALSADTNLEGVFGAVQQFVSPDLDPQTLREYAVPGIPQPGISKNAMLIRRAAFERIGPFDETCRASEFFDWYSRANALGLRWRMLPEVVALRRQHSENSGRRLQSTQHDEILLALKRSLDMKRQTRERIPTRRA
jgi:glycosyltransferase involved in cell wall biosynthesis